MALGIHKPGQGYWTRVMTACLIALITLATAAFAWQQSAVVVDRLLPKSRALMVVRFDKGEAAVGQTARLLREGAQGGQYVVFATGVVRRWDADVQTVTVEQFVLDESAAAVDAKATAQDTKEIELGEGAATVRGRVQSVSTQAPIEPLYVQGGTASAILLVGAVLAFVAAGVRAKTVDFLVATDFEMRKVNWSTPREIIGSTWVVVGAVVLISLSLYVFDTVYTRVFQAMGVLIQ